MYREIKEEELKLNSTLGYFYFLDKKHPLAKGNSHSVYYHRHIASIKEGRWLDTNEHVHHIDGDRTNNAPENLEIMSASEHSKMHNPKPPTKVCPICGAEFLPGRSSVVHCSHKCAQISSIKLDGLTKQELEYLIWTRPFTLLAKQFNCSDTGVRKWAIRLGCVLPPPYFHSKVKVLKDKLVEYDKFKLEQTTQTL
jgi:hypothetical protein